MRFCRQWTKGMVPRLSMNRHEPRTAQREKAYLKHIIATPKAKRVESLDTMKQSLERTIRAHEELAGTHLDEDLLLAALADACVPELRTKLDMYTR